MQEGNQPLSIFFKKEAILNLFPLNSNVVFKLFNIKHLIIPHSACVTSV